MKSLDEIAQAVTVARARLRLNQDGLSRASLKSGDELFQTPLIALTILVVGRCLRAGVATADLTTWTLATLLRHAQVERGARDRIQWSATLRGRCADALVFLEITGLIRVDELGGRTLFVSSDGHQLVRQLSGAANEGGVLVRGLEQACNAIRRGGFDLI